MGGCDRRTLLFHGVALAAGLSPLRAFAASREPVIGGPCEGCDWVYDGMPATLASNARIAPATEPGASLVIEGVVSTPRGAPAAGVIVYAYHTDDSGIYPRARNQHGTLRGWARTDAQGRYRFDTIRPAAYPGRAVPEHVHMHVIEPGVGTYYIDELRFSDDALITAANRRSGERAGNGLVLPVRHDRTWQARRDIVLGRNIPGYLQTR
jgi:protocatechuate 3,4-dioxygenase beta subunit